MEREGGEAVVVDARAVLYASREYQILISFVQALFDIFIEYTPFYAGGVCVVVYSYQCQEPFLFFGLFLKEVKETLPFKPTDFPLIRGKTHECRLKTSRVYKPSICLGNVVCLKVVTFCPLRHPLL